MHRDGQVQAGMGCISGLCTVAIIEVYSFTGLIPRCLQRSEEGNQGRISLLRVVHSG